MQKSAGRFFCLYKFLVGVCMGKIKILHTADLHLNAPLFGLDSKLASIRKEEQRIVFSNIIELVLSNNVELLLISGDLFHTANVPMQTAAFVKKCFERISNVPVFISPGNHDFLSETSVYHNYNFGENVHIFKNKLDFYEIENKKVRVWGFGFNSPTVTRSCLENFTCPDVDYTNILLMHAEIANEGVYNPTTADMMENAKFDYVALGHIHSYDGINFKNSTAYAYSGMPEGLYFDEPGKKGVIIGDVSKGFASLKFVETSKRENVTLSVDITGLETYEEVAEKINALIEDEKNLYKIILKGELKTDIYFDKNILELKLANSAFFIKIVDETETLNEINKGSSVLAKAFEEILKGKQLDEAIYKKAIKYGMKVLEGREVNDL